MIFEKNLKALKNHYSKIYDYIIEDRTKKDKFDIEVRKAKNNENILVCKVNGQEKYFNSRYNPTNEAEKSMEDMLDMTDESLIIMFGFSNGSFVRNYLSNGNEKTKCVVYEPSIDLFIEVIKNIDIADIIESPRVRISVVGINEKDFQFTLQSKLQIYNKDLNKHFIAPKYTELFNDEYMVFKKILIELYERVYILTNTAVRAGKVAVKNDILNMRYLEGCSSGTSLAGAFPEDMIGIVVSAGPSLEKNVHLLKQVKGKAFIIVVDSAINTVLNAGITPDAIVSVDMEKSPDLFMDEGVCDIPFVTVMDMNVEVFDMLKPKHLIFSSSDSLVWDKLFKSVGSDMWSLLEGGSVATSAIANLVAWGFKKIVMIGQDLCFTNNQEHAGEDKVEIDLNSERYTQVMDIYGNMQPIRKDYYLYLKWIENTAYCHPEIEFIDATEGGSLKQYTTLMTLQEVIDKYCSKDYDIDGIFKQLPRLFLGDDRKLVVDALYDMKNNFENMMVRLKNCILDCNKGAMLLKKKGNNINELKRINQSIKSMDKMIDECQENSYIYKYAAKAEANMMIDMYKVEEDDILESIRMYEKSANYYTSLKNELPDLIELIDECLSKMV